MTHQLTSYDELGGELGHDCTYDATEACRQAVNLARNLGWTVFPVRSDKRPATPHGFKDASKDADCIKELWRRYPASLIGVATGAASGVSVLDIDVKHQQALRWWRDNESRMPESRAFRTRSGGVHLFFQHAPGVRCSTGRPAAGVDVRGEGGYIICWFTAGYECLDHSPLAMWPKWLTKLIWPPPPHRRMKHARHDDDAVAGILRAVSTAPEGSRNKILFWAACRLRERGFGQREAETLLLPTAKSVGLDHSEAARTIASAWRGAR